MIKLTRIQITEKHSLYRWCEDQCKKASNLYNAALFRERQMLTSSIKPEEQWTDLERQVREEIVITELRTDSKLEISKTGFMEYEMLKTVLLKTHNPDYRTDLLSTSKMYILKEVCRRIEDVFKDKRENSKHGLPKYKKKGGKLTFCIGYKDYKRCLNEKGKHIIHFRGIKEELVIPKTLDGFIIAIRVIPKAGCFEFSIAENVEEKKRVIIKKSSKRIAGVDMGVENIMAVVNNCGLPCLLYKGGTAKSANHYFNVKASLIMSEQTKGGRNSFVPTKTYERLLRKRNNRIDDFMHKVAKHFINWCKENEIDTIVIGENKYWKNKTQMKKNSNRRFVQIPHDRLKRMIKYLALTNDIKVYMQEESFTSKASFEQCDVLPVFGYCDQPVVFHGKREGRLYINDDRSIVNADLNGAANILKKKFKRAFDYDAPHFDLIQVIRHPDISDNL